MQKALCIASTFVFLISGGLARADLQPSVDLIASLSDDGIVLSGKTNLPDDMDMMATVTAPTGGTVSESYTIKNGEFVIDIFPGAARIPAGKYKVVLSSPSAAMQPESVQKVIGEKGGNLSGNNVSNNKIFGKMVSITGSFVVPSGASEAVSAHSADEQNFKNINKFFSDAIDAIDASESIFNKTVDAAEAGKIGNPEAYALISGEKNKMDMLSEKMNMASFDGASSFLKEKSSETSYLMGLYAYAVAKKYEIVLSFIKSGKPEFLKKMKDRSDQTVRAGKKALDSFGALRHEYWLPAPVVSD